MQSVCLKGANFGLLHRSNQIRSPPRRTRAALPALRGAQHLRRIDPSASSTAAPEVGTAPGVRYPARGRRPVVMSYVERILQPGEQIRHISSIHWIVYWPGVGVALLAAVAYWLSETRPLTRFWLYTACALALVAVALLVQ